MRDAALICAPPGGLRDALRACFSGGGTACHVLDPATGCDEPAWQAAVAASEEGGAQFRCLVHAVPPPAFMATHFSDFSRQHEQVIGSLWTGAKLSAQALRERSGGAIVVVTARDDKDLHATMFGDGLRALASCFGVAWSSGDRAVRVNSIATTADILRGNAAPPQLDRAAALVAAMTAPEMSYVTAAIVPLRS